MSQTCSSSVSDEKRDHEIVVIQDIKQHSKASEHLINEDISAAEWEMTSVSWIKQHQTEQARSEQRRDWS